MSQKTYCVYLHTFPNGKVYVGITSQKPENRWKNGKKYAYNQLVGRAIEKYGWDAIRHDVLFDGLTETEAKNKEIELIKQYNSQNRKYGYNLTAGGDGMTGFKTYESTKKKLSEINTGKQHTEESRRKMSEAHKGEKAYWYGKQFPDYMRKKISEGKKGKKTGEDAYWYGKVIPESVRRKMSQNHADVSGANNPKARAVVMLDKAGKLVRSFQTVKEAAEYKNCNVCSIRRYCTGAHNDRSGYIWRYVDESISNEVLLLCENER
jgi:group I intron endonuclease